MASKSKIDMTCGSITKNTFLFALPLCFGSVLQLLYNTVDTIVVGNFCGSASIAAVGTSAQPPEIILCLFLGIGNGISILVAQAVGKKDSKEVRLLARSAVFFEFSTAIPLTAIGLLVSPLILKIMAVPDDAFELALSYLNILFAGTLGQIGYNVNAGVLRGHGDSKASLIFLLISCITNIVLDLVFVAGFHFDVKGVAIATVISIYISWIASIIYIKFRYQELDFSILPKKPDFTLLKRIYEKGVPLGMNNSLYSFGHLMMQAFINSQGSAFMAGCAVATKVTGIANVAINSFSSAGLTFAGQNYGAKNYARLRRGGVQIPFMSGLITIAGGIPVLCFVNHIIRLFSTDPLVVEYAVLFIRIVLPCSWCYAIFNGIINIANGLGDVKYSTVVNILMLWAVRLPSAWLIKTFVNGHYLMAGISISFVFGLTCMLFYFRSKRWKDICQQAKKTAPANVTQ